MKNTKIILISIALTALLLAPGLQAEEKTTIQGTIAVEKNAPESELASKAKVTLTEALKTASGDQKGTPIKAELETEKGFLVWSVEFSEGTSVVEVVVDAGSGKILATEQETPEEKKAEKSEDKD